MKDDTGILGKSTRTMSPAGRSVAAVAALVLLGGVVLTAGCGASGKYVGETFNEPVRTLVVFDIEDPKGDYVTRMLGTALTRGTTVIYGKDIVEGAGTPDIQTAAALARQKNAQAFLMGRITRGEREGLTQYVVEGTFELHDARNGRQVGGVPDARCKMDSDGLVVLELIVVPAFDAAISPLHLFADIPWLTPKMLKSKREDAEDLASSVRQKLADHVALELIGGLGKK